jgi:hypothetical protein
MKYLYLRYLNFRLWLIRRRLRRMGFTATPVATPPRLKSRQMPTIPTLNRKAERLDHIKIGIACFGVASMWLIFFLRQSGPVEVKPSPDVPITRYNLISSQHHE